MQTRPHPALSCTPEDKFSYLSIVASIANADGIIAPEEIDMIRKIGEKIKLSTEKIDQVILEISNSDPEKMKELTDQMIELDLQPALMMDYLSVAFVDKDFDESEKKEIDEAAQKFGFDGRIVHEIEKFCEILIANVDQEFDMNEFEFVKQNFIQIFITSEEDERKIHLQILKAVNKELPVLFKIGKSIEEILSEDSLQKITSIHKIEQFEKQFSSEDEGKEKIENFEDEDEERKAIMKDLTLLYYLANYKLGYKITKIPLFSSNKFLNGVYTFRKFFTNNIFKYNYRELYCKYKHFVKNKDFSFYHNLLEVCSYMSYSKYNYDYFHDKENYNKTIHLLRPAFDKYTKELQQLRKISRHQIESIRKIIKDNDNSRLKYDTSDFDIKENHYITYKNTKIQEKNLNTINNILKHLRKDKKKLKKQSKEILKLLNKYLAFLKMIELYVYNFNPITEFSYIMSCITKNKNYTAPLDDRIPLFFIKKIIKEEKKILLKLGKLFKKEFNEIEIILSKRKKLKEEKCYENE